MWSDEIRDQLVAHVSDDCRLGIETVLTFVMVTTPPNALIARITDRMPAILPRVAWPGWLGEANSPLANVKALLQTFEDGGNWTMEPQVTSRPARAPKPAKQKTQGELF